MIPPKLLTFYFQNKFGFVLQAVLLCIMKPKSTTTSFRIEHIKKMLLSQAKKRKMSLHEYVVGHLENLVDYRLKK